MKWLLSVGKSERTAKSYSSAVRGVISEWAIETGFTEENLFTIQTNIHLDDVVEKLSHHEIFLARNAKGNNMYSAALSAYGHYLRNVYQDELASDVEHIQNDTKISETEKARLVSTRLGQGEFRRKLIEHWQGCAVTGYQSIQFLVASHIKPWRHSSNEERLDIDNG